MNSLVHADIFFFISSIGFILLFVLAIVALVYVVGILAGIKRIASRLEHSIDHMSDEAKEFFADIQDSVVYRLIFRKKRK